MKVVFHVDEEKKWQEASKNIGNLLDLYPEAKVVLTVNGVGIKSFLTEEAKDFITNHPQVLFHACNNALKAFAIDKNALPKGVEVVPAGVADLIFLQEKGYAYIRP